MKIWGERSWGENRGDETTEVLEVTQEGSKNTAGGREFLLKKGDRILSCKEVVLSEVHRRRKQMW